MRTACALIGVFVLLCPGSVLRAKTDCDPITSETAERLTKYVHDKFRFPPTFEFELGETEVVGKTCFRKLHFRAKEQSQSLDVVMFLSPDSKFLSRELFDTTTDPADQDRQVHEALRGALRGESAPVKGARLAPVTITVFSDFQCPYCKQAMEVLNKELLVEPKKVRIVFRNLPSLGHAWARRAAEMAMCANIQSADAFWRVHDFLFSHQAEITSDNHNEKVMSVLRGSVDIEQHQQCLTEHKGTQQIDKDIAVARNHRIDATPTVFINRERWEGLIDFTEIHTFIQQYAADADLVKEKHP